MKVFILCGGEGTRLRPYTYDLPKPMLLLGNKPILQHIIERLKKNGLIDYILTVGYLKEKIIDYFGNGSKFGVNIKYAEENEPLGTAGSTLSSKSDIDGAFVVLMGDALIDFDIKDLVGHHRKSKCIATVVVKKHITKVEYGVAKIENKLIKEFVEKPELEHFVNTGIYLFESRIFDFIKEKEDFAKNVFPRLLKSGEKINSYELKGKWIDIGRKEDYDKIKNGPLL